MCVGAIGTFCTLMGLEAFPVNIWLSNLYFLLFLPYLCSVTNQHYMTNTHELKTALHLVADPETLMLHRHRNSFSEDQDGHITGLNLCESELTDDFLSVLNELPHLRALNLSGNNITSVTLPETLTALRWVDFSDCSELKSLQLPPQATDLTRLDTSDSKMETLLLPDTLPQLEYLDVSRNQLTQLILRDMPAVKHIDLSGNTIENLVLPDIFNRLERLYLGDCTLSGIPDEIYKEKTNSAEELKTFFRAGASGFVLNAEAKVIFFGNQMAGKTTLSKQLRENIFEKIDEKDRTHGILVWDWAISQVEFPKCLKDKIQEQIEQHQKDKPKAAPLKMPDKIQLNVWDFGGQEYFHATHRLFLNNNVLYLVVWESATDHQNEAAGDYPRAYWHNNIQHYSDKSTVLQVQNKAADNAAYDYNRLEYSVALRDEQQPLSLKKYDWDVTLLREKVLEQLSNLKVVGEIIPQIYEDIRSEVKRMKETHDYLSFSEFEALCRRMDKTEERIMQDDAQIEQVTNFLHDTGCLICYRFQKDKKSDKLDNYVFINPRWVTDIIYAILDKETLENKGEFDKKRVVSTLEKQRNDLTDSNLWIELMKEFELIFSKKDQPDQFVAPQYLPPNCKDLSEKAMNNLLGELPHRLVLHYPDFLPRSVISRFICRYGDLAKDEFWKYGIVLHKGGDKILVSCEYEHKNITIRSARRCSDLALEALDTLRKIDHFPSLELGVSDITHPDQFIGPVRLDKLEQEIFKVKTEVEWQGQWIPLRPFIEVFRRREMGHPEGKDDFRGIRIGSPSEPTFPIGEIIETQMAAGARTFVPFSEVQGQIRLLYMAATPMNQGQLNTGKESRFKDLIEQYDRDRCFNVEDEHGITQELILFRLNKHKPHIFHFGGHGDKEGIVLDDGSLEGEILLDILKEIPAVQCVVLNACHSLEIAQQLAQHIPYVIGTRAKIADETAIQFARGFYQALATNTPIESAFKLGVASVKAKKLPNPDVLVLVKGINSTKQDTPPSIVKPNVSTPPADTDIFESFKASNMPKKIFFSYSQHDRAHLDAFLTHLSALRRNGKIQPWDDKQLKGGEEWDETIKQQLAEADIIVLLLSPNFIATDYIWDVEIKAAMERHARGDVRVVPVVVRPCDWKDLSFSKLNALPSKAKPVVDYPNADTAWLEVVNGIKAILD